MERTLGLAAPPQRRYLYIGQDEQNSNSCWYELTEDFKKHYLPERGLWGYLAGVRFRMVKTSKGDKLKFELLMDAGQPFTIRAGAETTFTRGVLLALAEIANPEDLGKLLCVAVQPSEQNTKIVFGSVYFGETGQRIKAEWDKDLDLPSILGHLQTIVGDGGLPDEEHHDEDGSAEDPGPPVNRASTNDSQRKELLRCAVLAGLAFEPGTPNESVAELNKHCQGIYGKNYDQLTRDEAIEYRKTLRSI